MRITFFKMVEDRLSYWEAVRGKRTRIPGTPMALGRGGMPHDLLQLLVEGTVGIDDGFWGSVAAGATFRSTGRKRTKPGRAVIAQNRGGIDRAEHVVGEHLRRWTHGEPTPCAEVLNFYAGRWVALDDGEGLTIDWPSLTFLRTVESAGSPVR
ncbi:MAG TPA: hypothetical protein VMN58_12175 [Acidimicrobiales bacterium]|nr:hypothetical protein [Acidimicrobiales bacterium]